MEVVKLKKLDLNDFGFQNNSDGNMDDIQQKNNKDIAIIGIAVKMPLADDVNQFWNVLRDGVDCIRPFPDSRKNDTEKYLNYKNIKEITYEQAAYLNDIDKFDYNFFKMSPKEASLLDPNQRLFLETAWTAIEDAGYGGDKIYRSKTGAFIGFGGDNQYSEYIKEIEPESAGFSAVNNLNPFIASRLSYLLDLKGPSMLVNTTCSSSLVAVHLACQSLRLGETDMAIAGGVNVNLLPLQSQKSDGVGILSKSGKIRAFDERADGTMGGEGVAAILLKPLHKALRDGDIIHAIIKGSAINQDGSSIGLTAPNALAQSDVITSAWEDANIDPNSISFIEAHGTGTKLGDPIEVDGIHRAFSKYSDRKQFCAVSSVKSNIGHLDSAAGITGLLKMVLSMKNKEIPQTLHFEIPNSKINFEESPVYVNKSLINWESNEPRRGGVSSFGLSGTNCHIVLEQATSEFEKDISHARKEMNLFTISAKSKQVLCEMIKLYENFIRNSASNSFGDICYTASTGRGHYTYRIAILCEDRESLLYNLKKIRDVDPSNIQDTDIFYGECVDFFTDDDINKRIEESVTNSIKDKSLFLEIAKKYVNGGNIKWKELHQHISRKTVQIPTYKFERTRCWLEVPLPLNENAPEIIEDNLFYALNWKKEGGKTLDSTSECNQADTILFIDNGTKLSEELSKRVIEQGHHLLIIKPSQYFNKISSNLFEMKLVEEHYNLFFEELKGQSIQKIIYLDASKQVEDQSKLLDTKYYSISDLVKSLNKNKLRNSIELIVVAEFANKINASEDHLNPDNSILLGLTKAIDQEYKHLNCTFIDIDQETSAGDIAIEINDPEKKHMHVAYRQGERYVAELCPLEMTDPSYQITKIREKGTYIITGGTGGIGLALGKYIAEQAKVNLILINRSKIPDRSEWEINLERRSSGPLQDKIRKMIEIEQLGSQVMSYSADVSNFNQLENVFKDVKQQFGDIHGIIHAAGVAGDGMIFNRSKSECDEVLFPKVYGSYHLHELTLNEPLDFFVLCSSATSLTGAAGQADYTAANAFLDAFSEYRNMLGRKTLSINWTTWKEVGMAVDYGVNLHGMSTVRALYAFENILNNYYERVLVCESESLEQIELDERVPFVITDEKFPARNLDKDEPINSLEISLNKFEEVDELETKLKSIWKHLLEIDEITIDDDFFDLGGHSLFAVKLEIEMEKNGMIVDGVDIISDIYDYPTIRQLASHIRSLANFS